MKPLLLLLPELLTARCSIPSLSECTSSSEVGRTSEMPISEMSGVMSLLLLAGQRREQLERVLLGCMVTPVSSVTISFTSSEEQQAPLTSTTSTDCVWSLKSGREWLSPLSQLNQELATSTRASCLLALTTSLLLVSLSSEASQEIEDTWMLLNTPSLSTSGLSSLSQILSLSPNASSMPDSLTLSVLTRLTQRVRKPGSSEDQTTNPETPFSNSMSRTQPGLNLIFYFLELRARLLQQEISTQLLWIPLLSLSTSLEALSMMPVSTISGPSE